jgi:hypothetical protein
MTHLEAVLIKKLWTRVTVTTPLKCRRVIRIIYECSKKSFSSEIP